MHCDDGEAGESTIVEVFQQGFICGDKVIRFSMLTVKRPGRSVAFAAAQTKPGPTLWVLGFCLRSGEMGSDYRVPIDGKNYTPQEISAMVLQSRRRPGGWCPRWPAPR